jgi:hypothetical protein
MITRLLLAGTLVAFVAMRVLNENATRDLRKRDVPLA